MKKELAIVSSTFVVGTTIAILLLMAIGILFKTGSEWVPGFIASYEFIHLCLPFVTTLGIAFWGIDVLADKYAEYEIKKYRRKKGL